MSLSTLLTEAENSCRLLPRSRDGSLPSMMNDTKTSTEPCDDLPETGSQSIEVKVS
jgi:hypothetical protein